MTLQQLRQFAAVAQLENISRASEILHMSQSAISKNIAKIEEELGAKLFLRNGKKIELNPAGIEFLACCNQVLHSFDMATEQIRATNGIDNRIRIGSDGVYSFVIKCLAAFSKQNPDTEFDLNTRIETEEYFNINDFDMLVYQEGPKYEKYSGYHLENEKYYLAVPNKHPLAIYTVVNTNALTDQDFVFLRTGKNKLEIPYEICSAMMLPIHSQSFTDSRELHRQMIAEGVCLGFVPESEIDYYRTNNQIIVIPISDKRFSRKIMVCFRKEKYLSEYGRLFMKFATEYFRLKL